ncbi:MAG: hypothetical protein M3514_14040 [Actinomycetota bacterium]|nr:hypothetical protein [Rubrobacteraceae bacterium]MDQ3498597.1 hypothetical protein [Actinomycetota bacterium]
MTRYYALVLVPEDVPEDEACDAAFDLLLPFILTDSGQPEDAKFDYLLDPEDISVIGEDEGDRNVWRAGDIADKLGQLQVEAIVTPDGRWHEVEPGQMWDDEAWVAKGGEILLRQPGCLALRHVLHT